MYPSLGPQISRKSRAYDRARRIFWQQYWRSRYRAFWGHLRGQPRKLLYLGDVEKQNRVVDHVNLAAHDVRLSLIQGSHNQARTYYDSDWLPMQILLEERWVSVASLMLRDMTRVPPAELVQVGEVYYVIDGHHRVSAAHALGNLYLNAEVTVWEIEPLAGAE